MSVPVFVTSVNLSISVAEAPGAIVEFPPSVPSPRVVVGHAEVENAAILPKLDPAEFVA